LVSIGLVLSEEKIFEKVYDVRQVIAIAHHYAYTDQIWALSGLK
jgi:hypothetical protein